MSWAPEFRCDFCGKERRADANHWWVVWVSRNGVLMVSRWDLVIGKDDQGYRHACGRACTLRATERFMETGNLTLEAVPV